MSTKLQAKILILLGQGIKFNTELEKLLNRGINNKIYFTNDVFHFVYDKFDNSPKFLFVLGKEDLLLNKDILVVNTYSNFQKVASNEEVIFITDRKFDLLLTYQDIIKSLENKSVLLISNSFFKKSEIKLRRKLGGINKKRKVFISGSRSQSEITENIQTSLNLIMKQNINVLIGDSNKGVDKEVIDFFRGTYDNVEVFTITEKPRVTVDGNWGKRVVKPSLSLSSLEKQMAKDRVMADEADWGLAVFNPITKNRYGSSQVSVGTLRNTIQMLLNKKAVKFFYVFENEITYKDLKSIEDLEKVIEQYRNERLSINESNEILTSNGIKSNSNLAYEKYKRIYNKFKELIVNEQQLILERGKSISAEDKTDQISFFRSSGASTIFQVND